VTLVFSSAYRSYEYQAEVYARHVREMGQAAADRASARPGHSQHQLGTVVDFGSIDNSFAESMAGLWMAANAGRFGFSLSYPKGAEGQTGYDWESWHYRYVGKAAAALEAEYFGLQHWMMVFLERFLRNGINP
jgi:D-alanyl-D-alanine carboxypeptidase